MIKKNNDLQMQVLELYGRGVKAGVIARILNMPRRNVYYILKKNMVPSMPMGTRIETLISPRLLHFCDDIELLSKMLALELFYKKPEKIIIPKRLQKIIQKEKINKVVSILDKVNLKCEVEYA